MKVSCEKDGGTMVVTLQTPGEIARLMAALVSVRRQQVGSRLVDGLVDGLARTGGKKAGRAIAVTLETPDEVHGLRSALVFARRKHLRSRLADELVEALTTVVGWGSGSHLYIDMNTGVWLLLKLEAAWKTLNANAAHVAGCAWGRGVRLWPHRRARSAPGSRPGAASRCYAHDTRSAQ